MTTAPLAGRPDDLSRGQSTAGLTWISPTGKAWFPVMDRSNTGILAACSRQDFAGQPGRPAIATVRRACSGPGLWPGLAVRPAGLAEVSDAQGRVL